jgi:type VI secretion system protein
MGISGEKRVPLRRTAAKRMIFASLLAAILFASVSCSWIFGSSPPTIDTRTIDVEISPAANHDTPVALDIVYVFDEQVLTQLQMLSADDWFRQRDDFRALYPGKAIVSSYELIPGQLGPIEQVADKKTKAIGVFAFAKYQDPGAHRARLDRFAHIVIRLDKDDMVVAPQESRVSVNGSL